MCVFDALSLEETVNKVIMWFIQITYVQKSHQLSLNFYFGI